MGCGDASNWPQCAVVHWAFLTQALPRRTVPPVVCQATCHDRLRRVYRAVPLVVLRATWQQLARMTIHMRYRLLLRRLEIQVR